MQRAALKSLTLVFLLWQMPGAIAAPAKIYLFEDVQDEYNPQWCAFQDKKAFDAAAKTAEIAGTATLFYSDGLLTKISDVHASEADGFVITDDYALDAHGAVTGLQRKTVEANAIALDAYAIGQGRAHRVSRTFLDRKTRKPIATLRGVAPASPPVLTNLKFFSYYPLIKDPAIRTKSNVCARGR